VQAKQARRQQAFAGRLSQSMQEDNGRIQVDGDDEWPDGVNWSGRLIGGDIRLTDPSRHLRVERLSRGCHYRFIPQTSRSHYCFVCWHARVQKTIYPILYAPAIIEQALGFISRN